MISVTFDSNVWESIVDDSKRITPSSFSEIYELIIQKKISPFFYDGIVSLETIKKDERKHFIGSFKASISMQVGNEQPSVSEGTAPPELSDYLKENLPKAFNMGFKFLRAPRIGSHGVSPESEHAAKDTKFPLEERLNRTFEVMRFIEGLGAGKGKLDADISANPGIGLPEKVKNDTALTNKMFAKNIAEWVDGDALAAHYGFGIDYFCTNDKAAGAGSISVFSDENLKKITAKYGIRVVSPDDLVRDIKQRT